MKRRKVSEVLSSLPQFYSKEDQKYYKIGNKLKVYELCRLRSIVLFIIIIAASLGITVVHIIDGNFDFSDKLPFDTSNLIVLSISILWMNLANFSYQTTNIVTEMFQYGTIVILSMEFRILANKFENLKSLQLDISSNHNNEPSTSKVTKRSALIKFEDLKPLIDKHNQLLEIRDNLWNIHCTSFHIRFLLSSFQLCFMAFQITMWDDGRFLYISELIKDLFNIFFQCYFGQMLMDAGYSIAKAVQRIEWENIKDLEDQDNYKIKSQLKAFISYKTGSMVMFYITIILSLAATAAHVYQKNFEFSKKLPYDTSNVFVHSLSVIWLNYAHITYQITNIVMEIFQYGLVTILSMEFKILAYKFENLKVVVIDIEVQNVEASTSQYIPSTSKIKQQPTKRSAPIKLQDIKPLVDEHNQLLELRDLLWDVLSLSFHIRFILSSFQLCFLAYQITASNEKYLFIAEMIKNLLNIFFQCYFGQMLKDAGHSIAKSVQRLKWENIKDLEVRRSLMIIMMRSQESIAFRIIGTYDITVEQFTTIVSSAYSYYTLCLEVFN
ncbi:unnamed protein product [Chironomus riparius]|uniref:Odorant receptor n=1 Tax=Chironomus riparius TaxID=315576 RepID=A0A9N9S2B2_9DIPT|nr:unnamed protein product [Chironomus riparius]